MAESMTTETFELVIAGEADWTDRIDHDDIVLVLEERDTSGEVESTTRLATFSNMRFMDSLGTRLAKICRETAQAELAKAATTAPRPGWHPRDASYRPNAAPAGPEPYARLGDDVVVSDFDWKNPLMAWPGSWLFHDVKRDRALFIVRESAVGDAPSTEVLVALLLAFSAGERSGEDSGRMDGRAEMAGEMRALIGAQAA